MLKAIIILISMILFSITMNANQNVYVINYSWHTGFLIEVNDKNIELLPVLANFENYNYVDIGWGDREFYRSDSEFDVMLAIKAASYPTQSTVRIEGTNLSILQQMNRSNFLLEFDFSLAEFQNLADFINNSIMVDENYANQIESRLGGKILFFDSPLKYHLFNTCNTWIARGLEMSKCTNHSSRGIVKAGYFYSKFSDCGKILKSLR
jgi:hypothetical protein